MCHQQVGRPPWSAEPGVTPLYQKWCTGSPWHSLCPVLPVSLRAPSSSALFALVSLQVHKKKKKKISLSCILIRISCLPSSLHKNVFVVVQLPRKNGFVVRHCPQERFCGVLSPTRTIFVRGNHAPQGLLTLGQLTWFFTNSHIILLSVWFVCLLQCLSGTSEGRCRECSGR